MKAKSNGAAFGCGKIQTGQTWSQQPEAKPQLPKSQKSNQQISSDTNAAPQCAALISALELEGVFWVGEDMGLMGRVDPLRQTSGQYSYVAFFLLHQDQPPA